MNPILPILVGLELIIGSMFIKNDDSINFFLAGIILWTIGMAVHAKEK